MHDEAPSDEETDWPQILALYQLLRAVADGPVVMLNQAVAAAKVHGPAAGLALLDRAAADPRLAGTTASTPSARTCWRRPATGGRAGPVPGRGPADDEPARAPLPAPNARTRFCRWPRRSVRAMDFDSTCLVPGYLLPLDFLGFFALRSGFLVLLGFPARSG